MYQETTDVPTIPRMGVACDLQLGMGGTGVPQRKIFCIMTVSQKATKTQHEALVILTVAPGGRIRTTVTVIDKRVAL